MNATDLRIGNLVNYKTSEGDVLTNVIDWQDLKWLSEDEELFNLAHSPIPLTEEWLLKFGFEKQMMWTYAIDIIGNKKLIYYLGEKGWSIGNKNYSDFSNLKYVHQLQNLYFALTGTELI
jgi:hypothetical protein